MTRPTRQSPYFRPAMGVILLLTLNGCKVGPNYKQPDMTATTTRPWQAADLRPESTRLSSQVGVVAAWWNQFGDPELVRLIGELFKQNLTLAEARQRVIAARAARGRSAAERYPRIDGNASMGTAGTGNDAVNYAGPPPGRDAEVYAAGLSSVWELDLWGRVERSVRAADAEIDVSVDDYHDAAVSLAADLATAYVDLRTQQARLIVLDKNIELQKKSLALAESELQAGTGTQLGVAQIRRQIAQTLALRPEFLDAAGRSENRIALLLGKRPGDVEVYNDSHIAIPDVIGLGLPAELIERRPDIRRSIAAYHAAVERIGVAKAERYPTVTVSGTLNLQSTDITNFVGGHAFTYSLGPSLRVPLLDNGRIDANVRERAARAEELRLATERSLLQAINEVENAAIGVVRNQERQKELAGAVAEATRAVNLADELQRAGLSDLLQVVDAQRELVAIEDKNLVARRDALVEAIRLYRALGGGWMQMPLPAPAATQKMDMTAKAGQASEAGR